MATVETRHWHEIETSGEVVAGGSIAEIVGGGGAVVLAILGLAGLAPFYMLAVGTIAVGAALLLAGGAVAVRHQKIAEETATSRTPSQMFSVGMTAEAFAGTVGIVLGILALLDVVPEILAPVAMIVFGGGLLIGSATTARLNALAADYESATETARRVARESVSAAAGVQVLVGTGAATLGILALIGMAPMTLSLVAILSVATSVLLSGTAVGGKMMATLYG